MSCGQCTLGYSVLWTVYTRVQCLVDDSVAYTRVQCLVDDSVAYTRVQCLVDDSVA